MRIGEGLALQWGDTQMHSMNPAGRTNRKRANRTWLTLSNLLILLVGGTGLEPVTFGL
jgi:hypothetical protein